MHLLESIQIKELKLPNRVVLTAMVTRLSGTDGFVNDDVIDRYVRFAQGETGLIVVEATAVHDAKSGQLLRLSADSFIPGHKELTRSVHAAGPGKVALQIIHFLKIARSGWRQTIEMLDEHEIENIIDGYASAAVRAREAGYDAVELHMAHAYTLSSFLSRVNHRRDRYGGRSLEGRLRLPTRVVLAVREAVGTDFPIGVRFDAEECIKGGYGLAESTSIALRLAESGCDYISLSAGGKFEDAIKKPDEALYPYTGYSGDRTMPAAQYPDGANVYLAEAIKAHLLAAGNGTPVVASGKIPTPAFAERILERGQADMIGLARALLADPDWPKKARMGRQDEIVHCVYGNVCKALDENFRRVRCVLWPKSELHAPLPAPEGTSPPEWPKGDVLSATLMLEGHVALSWAAAKNTHGVYGYDIERAVGGGGFERLTGVNARRHIDALALGGSSYRYRVRAYDFSGRRSKASNVADVSIPSVRVAV